MLVCNCIYGLLVTSHSHLILLLRNKCASHVGSSQCHRPWSDFEFVTTLSLPAVPPAPQLGGYAMIQVLRLILPRLYRASSWTLLGLQGSLGWGSSSHVKQGGCQRLKGGLTAGVAVACTECGHRAPVSGSSRGTLVQ